VFKDYLGLDIGAEQCIISILYNNEKLLYKIHTEDLTINNIYQLEHLPGKRVSI
jgi:lipopolysaccharide biosynthesis glycosyltransferase